MVNASQRYFVLQYETKTVTLQAGRDEIEAQQAVECIQKLYPDDQVILVISRPFTDRWFSHPNRKYGVITVAEWEEVFAPPSLRAYLMYHFAEALLGFEADLSEEMHVRHSHEPARGCISDFCYNKSDVKLGMVAGNLCPECEATFLRYGMKPAAIAAIWEILAVVRNEAIGRPRILNVDSAFVIMRFSENDENNNAYLYGIKPGLQSVGIDPVRADDKVQSSQILDQVFRHIERCRFVVAKVDVENLNVYFELGVAMGLRKDVLLVAEASLVLNLPADLRNWECLTYERGNYEQLRQRVSQYYIDNYGRRRVNS